LKIYELIERVKNDERIKEVILATSPDMEGEATAMYIKSKLKTQNAKLKTIKITRLAYGLPIGANLEYADYMTLKKAIEGRNDF
jgi:recombination protein RecR